MIEEAPFEGWPVRVVPDRHGPVLDYWRDRLWQHVTDYYAGIRLSKFPEDLRVYEHLLWQQKPEVIIEIGCQFGASSLWFADRLAALGRYGGPSGATVIAIDIDTAPAASAMSAADPQWSERIDLIEGDVSDPALADHVRSLVPPGANCMVIEDSAHEYGTTVAALAGFHGLVTPGGFFVVEDGVVDDPELRVSDDWLSGVHRAIQEFLDGEQGAEFVRREDLEVYGLTSHPLGFLQRRPSG